MRFFQSTWKVESPKSTSETIARLYFLNTVSEDVLKHFLNSFDKSSFPSKYFFVLFRVALVFFGFLCFIQILEAFLEVCHELVFPAEPLWSRRVARLSLVWILFISNAESNRNILFLVSKRKMSEV